MIKVADISVIIFHVYILKKIPLPLIYLLQNIKEN